MTAEQDEEFPKLELEGKTFWRIGCSKCSRGAWELYATETKAFAARCAFCGHVKQLPAADLKRKPDNDGQTSP